MPDFVEKEKPTWDAAAINPPLVCHRQEIQLMLIPGLGRGSSPGR